MASVPLIRCVLGNKVPILSRWTVGLANSSGLDGTTSELANCNLGIVLARLLRLAIGATMVLTAYDGDSGDEGEREGADCVGIVDTSIVKVLWSLLHASFVERLPIPNIRIKLLLLCLFDEGRAAELRL